MCRCLVLSWLNKHILTTWTHVEHHTSILLGFSSTFTLRGCVWCNRWELLCWLSCAFRIMLIQAAHTLSHQLNKSLDSASYKHTHTHSHARTHTHAHAHTRVSTPFPIMALSLTSWYTHQIHKWSFTSAIKSIYKRLKAFNSWCTYHARVRSLTHLEAQRMGWDETKAPSSTVFYLWKQ